MIKTEIFDKNFKKHLNRIQINRRNKVRFKGSYVIKTYGDMITDIDIQEDVYFNDKLLDVLYRRLYNIPKNYPLQFTHLDLGYYAGYSVPWTIDNNGDCKFNPEEVKMWIDRMGNNYKLPLSLRDKIKELSRKSISLRNIIEIEHLLKKEFRILWKLNDIKRKYIFKNNKRYDLLNLIKSKNTVLEFIYKSHGKIINIDYALSSIDRKYKKLFKDRPDIMYNYYVKDWYKIMKSIRWKIDKECKTDYNTIMKDVESLISLKYQLELYEKLGDPRDMRENIKKQLISNKIVHEGKYTSDIVSDIYAIINQKLKNSVLYYIKCIPESKRKEYLFRYYRGKYSKPVEWDELSRRYANNPDNCPFFIMSSSIFKKIIDLSVKTELNVDLLYKCFTSVSIQFSVPLEDIVRKFSNTEYSIISNDNNCILYKNSKRIGLFSKDLKKRIQRFVILS